MRTVGIVAEYNPFHKGHAYQLIQAKRRSKADAAIVVMSGCFSQRGDASLLLPSVRAEMALQCGADVVILLPAVWAVRDADRFAYGAVSILNDLHVDALSFGMENPDPVLLQSAVDEMINPSQQFQQAFALALSRGQSYASAQRSALCSAIPAASGLLDNPNNILAVSYIKALKTLHSSMEIFPIAREGNYHADTLGAEQYASAKAIRNAVYRGDYVSIKSAMNERAYQLLCAEIRQEHYQKPETLDQALIMLLRTRTTSALQDLPDLSEGIEKRIANAAKIYSSRAQLLSEAQTRRYSFGRLNRFCTHLLIGLTEEIAMECKKPDAAILLGYKSESKDVLKALGKADIPLIGRASDYPVSSWLQVEQRAFDVWGLGCDLQQGLLHSQGIVRV